MRTDAASRFTRSILCFLTRPLDNRGAATVAVAALAVIAAACGGSLTPSPDTARRLAMAWGVHAVQVEDDVHDVGEMLQRAGQAAQAEGFAAAGDDIAVVAGLPFGRAGSTSFLHVHRVAAC